ncbi:MlaD family protein [Fodinicola feengrottensis]|uniref:MlaD family protein n=1 Tax=Fodinicola feengrottensis TaxID=435914 RepID=UPI0013D376D1|nr:MlaD family protein [Fodinicola feengrottensis]
MSSTGWRIGAVIAALIVVLGGGYVLLRPDPTLTVAADFAHADGVFAGSKVAILGVPIGRVTSVEPRGSVVRVYMSLPRDTQIPANAQAWVTTPSVIADHTVEFTPAYTSGTMLSPGALIPATRTHSPIKWTELVQSLDTPCSPASDPTVSTKPARSAPLCTARPRLCRATAALSVRLCRTSRKQVECWSVTAPRWPDWSPASTSWCSCSPITARISPR